MHFIIFNGELIPAQEPVLNASNRAFKFGDGLFETIRVVNGQIPLAPFHFKRLFHGMNLLKISPGELTEESIGKYILQLCQANDCMKNARVRLQVYRNDDGHAGFMIEATPLSFSAIDWDDKGFTIDVFPGGAKSTDPLANLKSSNYLPYVMADIFAKENSLDDAIVLNANGKIADTSRANIFLIKEDRLYTPALSDGCVNGVMRSWLIQKIQPEVIQASITVEDLFAAREVFLTNAVFGIRWVRSFRNHSFSSSLSKKIYSELISTIFY